MPGHPIVGKWQWTRTENRCTEFYDYRADGTSVVLSGAERTDNVYTVSADPDSQGFYRLTMRVEKDHGGKDCADDESDSTGSEITSFIRFNAQRTQYLACFDGPEGRRCFGPLRKVGQE